LKPLTVAISQGRDMWEIFLFSKVQKNRLRIFAALRDHSRKRLCQVLGLNKLLECTQYCQY